MIAGTVGCLLTCPCREAVADAGGNLQEPSAGFPPSGLKRRT